MADTYPAELAAIEATVRPHVSLERLQNEIVQDSLEQLRSESSSHSKAISKLDIKLDGILGLLQRRTQQFTPPKAPFWQGARHPDLSPVAKALTFNTSNTLTSQEKPPHTAVSAYDSGDPFVDAETRAEEETGVYEVADSSMRGFVAPSPRAQNLARPHTEVDLVLPPLIAFCDPGA